MEISIVIGDRHQIFREGIAKILRQAKNIQVSEKSGDLEDLISKVQILQPDIVLVDIKISDMPAVVSGIQIINRNNPNTKIIGMDLHLEKDRIRGAIGAGVSGFVSKKSNYQQLYDAIIQVYSGKYYFCDESLSVLVKNCSSFS